MKGGKSYLNMGREHRRFASSGLAAVAPSSPFMPCFYVFARSAGGDRGACIMPAIKSNPCCQDDGRPRLELTHTTRLFCHSFLSIQPRTGALAWVGLGQAFGLGAMLLASGEKGHRSALPNASIMLHQPRSMARGQASDIAIKAKEVSSH